jgi:hypothetical protein
METESHLQHLYSDVPFHEILGKDVSKMNEKELEALIKTTRASRVSPSVRKVARTTAAKQLSGKAPKKISVTEDVSHLL